MPCIMPAPNPDRTLSTSTHFSIRSIRFSIGTEFTVAAGFFQYQCVVPLDTSRAALRSMLGRLPRAGAGSFLSVLKRLGHQSGLLSFPMEGYTLALDLPVNPTTLAVAADLDAIVKEHGGRLYLAKDARMPAAMLRQYPALDRFRAVRRAADPNGKFSSAMSQRLGL